MSARAALLRVVAPLPFRSGPLAPEAVQTRPHRIRTSQATHSHLAVVLHPVDLMTLLDGKLATEGREQASCSPSRPELQPPEKDVRRQEPIMPGIRANPSA